MTGPLDIHSDHWNRGRKPPDWPYHSGWMCSTRNGWSDDDREHLAATLRHCADILDDPSKFEGDAIQEVADVRAFLGGAQHLVPPVECWVVMKHYSIHDPVTGRWGPRPWVGCTTEQQAVEFAAAIEAHYDRGRGEPDRFKVEFGRCDVSHVVQPWLSVDDYVRRLKS